MKEQVSRVEMDRTMAARQTHCYTCGGLLGKEKVRCRICEEWQCSIDCLSTHMKTMNEK